MPPITRPFLALYPLIAALMVSCSTAWAKDSQIEEADKAIRAEDYARAANLLKPLAEKNDPQALHRLGLMARDGLGMPKSAKASLAYLQRAADADFPPALHSLGLIYENGDLVAKDLAQATRYYARAADSGHLLSQVYLALAYEQGQGIARDPAAALLWLKRAADAGSDVGQYKLGAAYALGELGPTDLIEGLKYSLLAARQGNEKARSNVASLENQMPPHHVSEAKGRAEIWRKSRPWKASRDVASEQQSAFVPSVPAAASITPASMASAADGAVVASTNDADAASIALPGDHLLRAPEFAPMTVQEAAKFVAAFRAPLPRARRGKP